jgi:HSP20 family protein
MADLVRWEPGREVTSLRQAIDRLFEESFIRPGMLGGWAGGPADMLPLDVYETADRVVVKAAVPGVKPEEVEVTITGDLLTIRGEFKTEERDEKTSYWRQERRYGSFVRQIGLPVGVNADQAQATFENGVLTLELPKVENAKAKTIKVTPSQLSSQEQERNNGQ